jgi:hypothetical protein
MRFGKRWISAALQASIEKKFPGVKVKIKRAEGLPVHELIRHLFVSVDGKAAKAGVEQAVAALAATVSAIKSREFHNGTLLTLLTLRCILCPCRVPAWTSCSHLPRSRTACSRPGRLAPWEFRILSLFD